MGAVDDRRGRRSLLLYFVVAYAFTWLLWVPPLLDALPRGWAMPSPDRYAHFAVEGFAGDRHLLLAVVFTVAVYGPLLGALIATSREQGAQGVRNLLAKTFNPRVAHRWYLVALIIAVAISSVPTLLAWVTGSLGPPLLDVRERLALFVPILLLQLLTSGLGEEPGWRGYLLPGCRNGSARSNRCGCSDWRGRSGITHWLPSTRCPKCRRTPPHLPVWSRSWWRWPFRRSGRSVSPTCTSGCSAEPAASS